MVAGSLANDRVPCENDLGAVFPRLVEELSRSFAFPLGGFL